MPEKRKPMLNAEELEFLGKKDNGFQKTKATPAAAEPPAVEPEEMPSMDDDIGSIESLKNRVKAKEATVRFTVDLTEKMHTELRMLSAKTNVKMTQLCRMAIANLIKEVNKD